MKFLVIFGLLVIFTAVRGKRDDPCTTPDGKSGTCVPLETCAVVFNAAASRNNNTRDFAIKSFCKEYDPDPLVCCESAGSVIVPNYKASVLPDTTICGLTREEERIIGGEVTKLGEFPWAAALEYIKKRTGEHGGIKCGGSVISRRHVLTTAHCIISGEFKPVSVLLGEWKISTDPDCIKLVANEECAEEVKRFQIKETIPHLFYSKRTAYNDIGLIVLENAISFTDYIRPICLPTPDLTDLELGTRLTVIGWGVTENGTTSDVLLKVNVPMVPNEECQKKLTTFSITSRQLCAGGEKGKDSCQGDAGGPLMKVHEDKSKKEINWYQHGVSAAGAGCGREGYPAIYTKVSSYMNWIVQVMSEE